MYPDNNMNNNGFNQNNFNMQSNGMNNAPLQNNQANQNNDVNTNFQNTNFNQNQMNNVIPNNQFNDNVKNGFNTSNQNSVPVKPKKNNSILLIILLLVIVTVIVVVVVLVLGNNNSNAGNNDNLSNDNSQVTNDNQQTDDDSEFYENWGVSERCSAQNGTSESYFINFPKYTGYSEVYGLVAEQLDDTVVVVSGQNDKCPAINSLSELFPAYFEHLQFTLEGIYGILSDNYNFSLKSNNSESIGGYQMHKFVGNIEFYDDGEHQNYQFVAYATTLKSNGAYAYWVVYDTSDDQSNGELIKEHALNMAKTFREE